MGNKLFHPRRRIIMSKVVDITGVSSKGSQIEKEL